MSQMFRTTLRFDLDKPASRQAAALLRQLHAERGVSYSALIIPAINADYSKAAADESLRETIRSIVREELASAPVQLVDLLAYEGEGEEAEADGESPGSVRGAEVFCAA